MAGIMFRMDGTHELVSFDGTDLASCDDTYKRIAVSKSDTDLVDVRAVKQGDGTIEYTTCIYDTAAGLEVLRGRSLYANKHFSSAGSCIGDVLMFKTRAAALGFDDMPDRVLPSIGISAGEGVAIVEHFSAKLGEFVTETDCKLATWVRSLFPFLLRHKVGGKWAYYECSGLGGVRGSSVEVDLLTFKTKMRRLTSVVGCMAGSGVPGIGAMCRALDSKRNLSRFCVVCDEPTRFSCSRCKGYYCCGSEACKIQAWKLHKKDCVKK